LNNFSRSDPKIQTTMEDSSQDYRQKRKEITETLSRELHKLPLDIEVWLYGSEARGESRPDSDIDILVLFNQPEVRDADEDNIFKITYPIELETGVLINPVIFPKKQWESRMTPFRLNVINDGIRL